MVVTCDADADAAVATTWAAVIWQEGYLAKTNASVRWGKGKREGGTTQQLQQQQQQQTRERQRLHHHTCPTGGLDWATGTG